MFKNKDEISLASVFVAVQDQVSTNLEDEAVILHLKKGVYYGLNAVGARIWSFLRNPDSVAEVRDMILQEYEVAPERCEQDILELLKSYCRLTVSISPRPAPKPTPSPNTDHYATDWI